MVKNKGKTVSAAAIVIALTSTLYGASVWASDNGDRSTKELDMKKAAVQSAADTKGKEKRPLTKEEQHEAYVNVAREWGVDISGMNDDQIEAALRAEKLKRSQAETVPVRGTDLQNLAKKLGIDTTGLSDEQVKQAIAASGKEGSNRPSPSLDKTTMTPEQYHQNLLDIAKELKIDTTGMNDDQIEDALKAEKMKHRQ